MLKLWDKEIITDVNVFMDTIGDGIFIIDTKGIITKANKASYEILGFSNKTEVEGQPALLLLGAIDEMGNIINKKNAALFKSLYKNKKITNAIRQFTKNDGNRIWTSITTTPIVKKNGIVKGAILVLRDITEEKQEEEYRTDFAHIASHDLRTPLGNVLWASEYLMSEKLGRLTKKQKEYVEDIYTTLKQMNQLVNDLLNVSRLYNKKTKAKPKKISLEKIVKQIIKSTSVYANARNVKIKLTTDTKREHYIKIDENHLKTIILNLAENAIRYSFDKTVINVKIKKENGHVLFTCANQGIGIPKDMQKFIFAKFFRAKNAVERQGDGTGLGLYLTSELVKTNKGKIWFTSEPEKETIFYVKFKS